MVRFLIISLGSQETALRGDVVGDYAELRFSAFRSHGWPVSAHPPNFS